MKVLANLAEKYVISFGLAFAIAICIFDIFSGTAYWYHYLTLLTVVIAWFIWFFRTDIKE